MAIRVMVVDDTKFMRIMLAEILRKLGCEVVAEVENGKNAISKYKELMPDLVMMDITMPEMDGIIATKEIRVIDSEAIIIICSAGSQEDLISEALKAGATDCLMKPFMPEKVKEMFDKIAPLIIKHMEPVEFLEESIEMEQPEPEPVTEPEQEPVTEPEPEPVTEPEPEPVTEPEPEPQPEPERELKVEAVSERLLQRIEQPVSNSNVIQLNKGGNAVKNFSSSYMCNWNEEVENENIRFLALYADGDRLVNLEMMKADGQRQMIKVSVDGFRQLYQWLEEKSPSSLGEFSAVAK